MNVNFRSMIKKVIRGDDNLKRADEVPEWMKTQYSCMITEDIVKRLK